MPDAVTVPGERTLRVPDGAPGRVDRVVAEIVPPQAGRSGWLADAKLAAAVREGWLSPPALPQRGVPRRLPVAPLADLLRELDEERGR